jgi:hypothetical protein
MLLKFAGQMRLEMACAVITQRGRESSKRFCELTIQNFGSEAMKPNHRSPMNVATQMRGSRGRGNHFPYIIFDFSFSSMIGVGPNLRASAHATSEK